MSEIQGAEIGAVRRCDGMGDPAEAGDYVLMSVQFAWGHPRLCRISIGAAALLIDELRGCLAAGGHTRESDNG